MLTITCTTVFLECYQDEDVENILGIHCEDEQLSAISLIILHRDLSDIGEISVRLPHAANNVVNCSF